MSSSHQVSEFIRVVSTQLKAFPILTSFAFEREYYWVPFTDFARNNYPLAFGLVVGYLVFKLCNDKLSLIY